MEKGITTEDFYFHHALEILDFKLPSLEECNHFCNNLHYPIFNPNSFGITNIDKDYIFENNRFRDEINEIVGE